MIIHSRQVIWKAEGVHPQELSKVLAHLTDINGSHSVACDILSLYYRARFSNGHISACNHIAKKLYDLAAEGFKVECFIDGSERPDCKRSSWERAVQDEFAKINAYFARQKIQALASLLDGNDSENPISSVAAASIRKEIKKLNAESISLERQRRIFVPKGVRGDIEDAIFSLVQEKGPIQGGKVDDFITLAKFQADSIICHGVNSGKHHIVFGNDTDYHMLLGPNHIVLRDFKNASKKSGVVDMRCEISGCSPETMNKVKSILTRDKIKWSEAKYPVFNTHNPVLRSLVGITLGTDVWPGIKGVGAAKVSKFLDSMNVDKSSKEAEKLFLGFMLKEASRSQVDSSAAPFDRDVISALSSAILDEAVVDVDLLEDPNKHEYMFGVPSFLPRSLEYFSCSGIVDVEVLCVNNSCDKKKTEKNKKCDDVSDVSSEYVYDESDIESLTPRGTEKQGDSSSTFENDTELPELITRADDDSDSSVSSGETNTFEVIEKNTVSDSSNNDINNISASDGKDVDSTWDLVEREAVTDTQIEIVKGPPDVNALTCKSNTETNVTSGSDSETWDFVQRGVVSYNQIKIVEGPPVAFCRGVDGVCPPHMYLKAEGTHKCEGCGVSFCRTCGFVPQNLSKVLKKKSYYKDKNRVLCFFCYKTGSVGNGTDYDNQDSVRDMKQKLDKLNVKVSPDALPHEMEDLLEHYSSEVPLFKRNAHNVDFPVYGTSFFSDIQEHVFYSGPLFAPEGFLNDTRISDKHLPSIVNLMAKFCQYNIPSSTPYAESLPALIIDFANRSRPLDGPAFKLMKSCIRHATDPRFPSMLDEVFSLFEHKCTRGESVGIILHSEVPASMKETMYSSKIAFTQHNLLACKCDCLASGEGTGDTRVTCVHNLPLIFMISILFHRGLATNFLHDLAVRWNGDVERTVGGLGVEVYRQLRRDIICLMRSTGDDDSIITNASTQEDIASMLETYQVTTQRKKCCRLPPPRPHELIPFRDLPRVSSNTEGKRMKTKDDRVLCKPCDGASNLPSHAPEPCNGVSDLSQSNESARDNDRSDNKNDLPDETEVLATSTPTNNIGTAAAMISPSQSNPRSSTTTPSTNNNASERATPIRNNMGTPALPTVATPRNTQLARTPNFPVVTNDSLPNNDGRIARHPWSADGDFILQAYKISFQEHMFIDTAPAESMPENVSYEAHRALIGRHSYHTERTRHIVNKWLTDEIINQYMVLLTKKDIIMNPPSSRSLMLSSYFFFMLTQTNRGYDYSNVSNWCSSFAGVNIFTEKKYIIVPVCLNNSHWTLITIDVAKKRLYYFDSMGGSGAEHLESMMRFLADYAREHNLEFDDESWTCHDSLGTVPQQSNCWDCGIFILNNAYLTLHGIPFHYDQEGVEACESRRIIALSLLRDDAFPPITIGRAVQKNLNVTENEFRISDQSKGGDNNSNSTCENNKKVTKRVNTVLFERRSHHHETSYGVDWIRCHGWLKTVYGKEDLPTHFLGVNAIVKRSLAAQHELREKHGVNAEKVIKKKMSVSYFDWRNIAHNVLNKENDHSTKNLVNNTNGCGRSKSGDGSTMTINRKYEKGTERRCAFNGCKSNSRDGIAFEKLPNFPPEKSEAVLSEMRPRDIKRYYRRFLLRQLCNQKIGKPLNSKKEYRICALHKKQMVRVSKTLKRDKKKDLPLEFTFVVPVAVKEEKEKSNGLGTDRLVTREVKDIPDDELKELTLFAMVSAHIMEESKKKTAHSRVNATVRQMLDIEDESMSKKLKISGTAKTAQRRKRGEVIRSYYMSDNEIKSKTGFESKKLMLAFIGIVCNGDVKQIISTEFDGPNFYEQWFLLFEMIWGRSWLNQKDLAKEYKVNALRKNDIADSKLRYILRCRDSWPALLTQDEDVSMRSAKWKGVFDETDRVVMHDTTNITMTYKPSQAEIQKLTHSIYYGGNNAKADVVVQPCGFVRTYNLWVAAITDTQYMIRNRIFEEQQQFQMNDLVNGEELPFMNILDRGYKLSNEAMRAGKQTVHQPMFKDRNQRRFTARESLQSAAVASIRSGNERAVRKAKLAGFLKKGLRPSECPRRLDDVWLAWGFMVNFMYRSTA